MLSSIVLNLDSEMILTFGLKCSFQLDTELCPHGSILKLSLKSSLILSIEINYKLGSDLSLKCSLILGLIFSFLLIQNLFTIQYSARFITMVYFWKFTSEVSLKLRLIMSLVLIHKLHPRLSLILSLILN